VSAQFSVPGYKRPPVAELLFLIRNVVDEIHITSDEVNHTVGLVIHL
jgi:hypothetical protein